MMPCEVGRNIIIEIMIASSFGDILKNFEIHCADGVIALALLLVCGATTTERFRFVAFQVSLSIGS